MKKILLFFAGLFVLLLASCTDSDYGTGDPSESQGNLSFYLSIPGSAINTYASVEAVNGEDEVHTLHVLFFEPSNDGSGKFLELHDISPANDEIYRSGQTIELKLPVESNISKSKAYNLLFIANPNYYLDSYGGTQRDWTSFLTDKTENEVKQLRIDILANDAEEGDADYYTFSSYIQDNLLMTGAIEKAANQEMVVAELTRIVSRFDIKNEAGDSYKLVSASVWNAFPQQTLWEINFSDFSLDRIHRLYGIDVENDEVLGGLYAYENFVTVPTQNDEKTTCLILGIENKGYVSYYRVNACQTGKSQQLRRNNAYTFTILSVKGAGENSEEDAYKSTKSMLNVQVNEWNIDDQGNIVFDGDNILAVSTTNIQFNYLGGHREYTVFTAGEGVLMISNQELPTGFTVELRNNILYVDATESEVDKAGYVELQFGKLKVVVNITQTGEIEQFLEVAPNMLEMFTAEGNQISEQVLVTSSGPWTATMYNAQDVFRFTQSSGTTLEGDNDEKFTIDVTKANTSIITRYAFVHVTLNANPQISGVVIVSQNGLDGFDIYPTHTDVTFDADGGQLLPSEDYIYTITVEDDHQWAWTLYGTHKDYFEVVQTGDKLEILSKGINPEPQILNAQLRISLVDNPSINRDINITQYAHSLTVTPTTFATIPADGGSSEMIFVTASTNWTATVQGFGNTAYFNSDATSFEQAGTDAGGQFQVTFPVLAEGNVTPQALVTVSLNGTNIKQTVVVSQRALEAAGIAIQNSNNLYGYLINNDNSLYRTNYVEQLYQSLINPEWFGTSGTVYCGGPNFMPLNVTPFAETDLFIMNSFSGSAADGTSIRSWLDRSPKHLLLALSDDRSNTLVQYLGLEGYTAVGGTGNNVVKTNFARSINTDDTYTMNNNKLYDYLFRTGPFTQGKFPIQKEDIKLLPYDASNNCLTSWPSTMIPLILDENDKSRLILGVDPTLRFIYSGEMDLFGTAGVSSIYYTKDGVNYTGAQNYASGPHSETNLMFLNNLISWMINVVMYGDEFADQFK